MKKLLLVALTALSLNAFADQEICQLHIYKTELFGEGFKGKRMNPDIVPLHISTLHNDITLINNDENDVLGFYKTYSQERNELKDILDQPNIRETDLNVRVLKRYIYDKVYLNIQSKNIDIDIPVVADQKARINIMLAKDVHLKCEN